MACPGIFAFWVSGTTVDANEPLSIPNAHRIVILVMIGAGVSEDYGPIAGMIFISREPMPQSKGFYRPVACKLAIYLEELCGSGMRENETLSIHDYFFVEWQLTKVLKYLGSGSFLKGTSINRSI